MTTKFNREFRLIMYPLDGGDPIIITRPFTIRFSMTMGISPSINPMVIEVLNLSELTRQRLFQDWYFLGGGTETDEDGLPTYRGRIILSIGYGTLYRVYYGRMTQVTSSREGTNIVTRIQAQDGIYDVAGTQVFQTLSAGQTVADVMKFLIGQFPTLELGAVGDFSDVLNRPVCLNGNVYSLLKQYSQDRVYINNGRVYVLQDKEVLETQNVINDASGLLMTPQRQEARLDVTTLLEPNIYVGEKVRLESTVQKEYDGEYKVVGLTHKGTISSAVSEQCISQFQLLAPERFNGFNVIN